MGATNLLQPYLFVKALGTLYASAVFFNNIAERHFRNRCIDKVYLILPCEQVPDVVVGNQKNLASDNPIAKHLEIHMINGTILPNLPIDQLKLLENPAKDPERGLLSKIKLTLTEMYMNEYYEGLTKNFV